MHTVFHFVLIQCNYVQLAIRSWGLLGLQTVVVRR